MFVCGLLTQRFCQFVRVWVESAAWRAGPSRCARGAGRAFGAPGPGPPAFFVRNPNWSIWTLIRCFCYFVRGGTPSDGKSLQGPSHAPPPPTRHWNRSGKQARARKDFRLEKSPCDGRRARKVLRASRDVSSQAWDETFETALQPWIVG